VVGDSAFKNCVGLTEVIFPYELKKIGSDAFRNCSFLRKIDLPDGVYEIGDSAFEGCTGLKEIVISRNFRGDVKRIFGDIDEKIIKY